MFHTLCTSLRSQSPMDVLRELTLKSDDVTLVDLLTSITKPTMAYVPSIRISMWLPLVLVVTPSSSECGSWVWDVRPKQIKTSYVELRTINSCAWSVCSGTRTVNLKYFLCLIKRISEQTAAEQATVHLSYDHTMLHMKIGDILVRTYCHYLHMSSNCWIMEFLNIE